MSRIVRTEVRKRGFFGKLVKLAFIAFNILMAVWVFGGLATLSDGAANLSNDYERAGFGAGAVMGMGALVFLWAAGDVILGLFVLFTRGKKTIIEERAA